VGGQTMLQVLRNQMIFIPELRHPGIVDSRPHPAIGARPIHRQNGFPDNEHAQVIVSIPPYDIFDCGGPPQTYGSCRRKQQDGAGSARVPVKGISELFKIGRVQ